MIHNTMSTFSRHAILPLMLFVVMGMTSCLDVEDEYGSVFEVGSIKVASTERTNAERYKAGIVVDFNEPRFAMQEFVEAGIIVENKDHLPTREIPLAHSVSELKGNECCLEDMQYNSEYYIRQYFRAKQKGTPESIVQYRSDVFKTLHVSYEAHLDFESISATPTDNTLVVSFTMNCKRHTLNNFKPVVRICPDKPEFDNKKNPEIKTQENVKRTNDTYQATFEGLASPRDYYVQARFYNYVTSQTVYSDTIKVSL